MLLTHDLFPLGEGRFWGWRIFELGAGRVPMRPVLYPCRCRILANVVSFSGSPPEQAFQSSTRATSLVPMPVGQRDMRHSPSAGCSGGRSQGPLRTARGCFLLVMSGEGCCWHFVSRDTYRDTGQCHQRRTQPQTSAVLRFRKPEPLDETVCSSTISSY